VKLSPKKKYVYPALGTLRNVRKFAWLPVENIHGDRAWLEMYTSVQQFNCWVAPVAIVADYRWKEIDIILD
jgi:hypothetical protein